MTYIETPKLVCGNGIANDTFAQGIRVMQTAADGVPICESHKQPSASTPQASGSITQTLARLRI